MILQKTKLHLHHILFQSDTVLTERPNFHIPTNRKKTKEVNYRKKSVSGGGKSTVMLALNAVDAINC